MAAKIELAVKQILNAHETSYSKRTVEKDWKWSCTCGQSEIFPAREGCTEKTKEHWAGLMDAVVTDMIKPERVPDLEVEVELASGEEEQETVHMDLSIMSYLVRQVDRELMTMPQARQALGEWWRHRSDKAATREPGKARMRRLKQISDGMFEEFWALVGSQS